MLNIYLNVFHSCFIQCSQCDCWHYMEKRLRWKSCTNDTESIWNDPFYETTTRVVTAVSEPQDYVHHLTILLQSHIIEDSHHKYSTATAVTWTIYILLPKIACILWLYLYLQLFQPKAQIITVPSHWSSFLQLLQSGLQLAVRRLLV